MMPTILAIDTSTEACSVALIKDNKIIHDFILAQREHTQHILPMIDRILAQAGMRLSQVDAIAFGQGPGSFTGVRIGIGVAQGLAFGANKPLIGVSTLMTLAQGAYREHMTKQVISAIDARMGEVYLGGYFWVKEGQWQPNIAECVIKPEAVNNQLSVVEINSMTYAAGTGWQTYPDMCITLPRSEVNLPHAQDMIVIAQHKWLNNEIITVDQVEPTYLRNEVTWKKLPGR